MYQTDSMEEGSETTYRSSITSSENEEEKEPLMLRKSAKNLNFFLVAAVTILLFFFTAIFAGLGFFLLKTRYGSSTATYSAHVTCIIDNVMGETNHELGLNEEFGVSYLIEISNKVTVLFDFGCTETNFLNNVKILGIDLNNVDFGLMSHPHFDHTGGMSYFATKYPDIPIIVHPSLIKNLDYELQKTFITYSDKLPNLHILGEPYFSKDGKQEFLNIGVKFGNYDLNEFGKSFAPAIDFTNEMNDYGRSVSSFLKIMDEEHLQFTNYDNKRIPVFHKIQEMQSVRPYELPNGSGMMFTRTEEGDFIPDDFSHEMNLVISLENEKKYLFTGCAHNGIANILASATTSGGKFDAVFGGFHLSFGDQDWDVLAEQIDKLSKVFYMGHCSGIKAYEEMRKRLGGDRVKYFGTGDSVSVF